VGTIPVKSVLFCCAAIAVVVVVLAGCGGGSSSSSGSSEAKSGASEGSAKGESASGGGESASGGGKSSGESASGGGESAGKSTPGGEISDSEFVKQANAICEEGKKQSLEEMSAYVKKHGGSSGGQKLAQLKEAILAVVVPAIQTQAEEIRALSVSGGEAAKVDAFTAALEEGVEAAEQAKGSSTAPFGQSFKHSAELAHEYGLDGCAYG
jgi:hypothetical protein